MALKLERFTPREIADLSGILIRQKIQGNGQGNTEFLTDQFKTVGVGEYFRSGLLCEPRFEPVLIYAEGRDL